MNSSLLRFIAPLVFIAIIGATTGCGSSSSASTAAVIFFNATAATETFTGSLGQNGSVVYNFSVANSGYSLLAGFTSIAPANVTALGLGIGTWDASTSTCGLNQMQNDTSHSGSTAISATAPSGAFCVRVYDAGNVGADVTATFTVQVQHY